LVQIFIHVKSQIFLEVVSKPPLGLNSPKADKSLCWTETVNP
jgi:hypothetical protein